MYILLFLRKDDKTNIILKWKRHVFALRIGHIGMMEFTKAPELIERGYRAMQHEIPLIQSVIDVLSQLPSAES